ncbi:MAG: hypothetical protein A2504_02750 [Bdellovibrionales bacterium RIFOXYD12_FULL_39_22]|nr:MAG: hypothetical protein A2385_05465 [Bdellovibrionales bacterium RIFOXYB1_FULL_39_21]OFZ42205.1 MAG: hypothetical protein A2485_15495 [Bdellovibrionales bacterium RIFOXYC12_FULL_39_17]OFZ46703.1 MAG: hypothetical protein A2404_04175 [Bdellovibrionales bacterium RIFOXYC1_FULL_39_130]OFZ76020.1 MAG: hypothetical protein A2560_02975 [Bdellovibrionales bacterium RIFOXYD1_FULL_39_84]OFZ93004.1 MAG: hypothetical protein A2504_02750 [Bdellovibrionales bacterium RIFOXYD12_FULL_39_22]HLE09893.1 hy
MKTLAFIGSDKNAGKTTALNYVYRQHQRTANVLCLLSIGINGESVDSYEGSEKPQITIFPDSFFVTAADHLASHPGKYATCGIFGRPSFKKNWIFAKALTSFNIVLEGPNEASEILLIKKELHQYNHKMIILLDGSIDRQFIANPKITDGIYFSLLISERTTQLKKAQNLLDPLTFLACPENTKEIIAKEIGRHNGSLKSLLIDGQNILHAGKLAPFLDEELRSMALENASEKLFLYLDGAFTKTLFSYLKATQINVVIDNFTQYQMISTSEQQESSLRFYLYNPVNVLAIFLNQESKMINLKIPPNIPVYNLFQEDCNEVRI